MGPRRKNTLVAVAGSTLLHGVLLLLAIYGARWFTTPLPPEPIMVSLLPGAPGEFLGDGGGSARGNPSASQEAPLPSVRKKSADTQKTKVVQKKITKAQPTQLKEKELHSESSIKIRSQEQTPLQTKESHPVQEASTPKALKSSNPIQQATGPQGTPDGQGTGKGSGHGPGEGGGNGPGRGGGQGGREARTEMERYVHNVLKKIDAKKRYPRLSKENGEEGVVSILLTIDTTGNLVGYRIAKSGPFERLTEATIQTVQAASPFPPLPSSYGQSKLIIEVPLRFYLAQR